MAIGRRIIETIYELKDRFTARISKIAGAIREVENASNTTTRKIESNNQRVAGSYDGLIGTIGKTKIAILSVAAVVGGMIAAMGKWTQAAAQQERADTKLSTTLRNLSGAREEEIQALRDQATNLQALTGYGDEQTISAQAMLGTFKLNAEQIGVLTPRLLDMAEAARRAGKAEIDLEGISIALGKAFTAGIGSLSRYGVAMDEAQKEAFKLADQGEKVKILAEILDQNFKGLAAAVGGTYEGAVRKAEAAQGDFYEVLGQQFTQNQDIIKINSQVTKTWNDMSKGVAESSDNIALAISGTAKSLAIISHIVRVAWNTIQSAFRVGAAAVVASVGSIADALGVLSFGEASDRFHRFAADMRGTSGEILDGVKGDWEDIQDSTRDLMMAFEDTAKSADAQASGLANLGDQSEDVAGDSEKLKTMQDELSASFDKASAAAEKEVKEFEEVSKSADATREKFAQLKDEMARSSDEADRFSFTDVVGEMTKARRAINEGDFSGAITGAERAGEMLRKMKENGDESDGVLTGLALKLQEIVRIATESQEQKELIDAQKSIGEAEKIKAKLEEITQQKVQFDVAVNTEPLEALRKIEPVVIPVRYEVVGHLPTFTDGTDVRHESDKRGYRP